MEHCVHYQYLRARAWCSQSPSQVMAGRGDTERLTQADSTSSFLVRTLYKLRCSCASHVVRFRTILGMLSGSSALGGTGGDRWGWTGVCEIKRATDLRCRYHEDERLTLTALWHDKANAPDREALAPCPSFTHGLTCAVARPVSAAVHETHRAKFFKCKYQETYLQVRVCARRLKLFCILCHRCRDSRRLNPARVA